MRFKEAEAKYRNHDGALAFLLDINGSLTSVADCNTANGCCDCCPCADKETFANAPVLRIIDMATADVLFEDDVLKKQPDWLAWLLDAISRNGCIDGHNQFSRALNPRINYTSAMHNIYWRVLETYALPNAGEFTHLVQSAIDLHKQQMPVQSPDWKKVSTSARHAAGIKQYTAPAAEQSAANAARSARYSTDWSPTSSWAVQSAIESAALAKHPENIDLRIHAVEEMWRQIIGIVLEEAAGHE